MEQNNVETDTHVYSQLIFVEIIQTIRRERKNFFPHIVSSQLDIHVQEK